MTTKHDNVRAETKRPARRGRSVLLLVGAVLLTTTVARARASVSAWLVQAPAGVQDSARVNELLGKVRGVDPVVCQLVGRSLDNRWGPGWGGMMLTVNGPALDQNGLLDWLNSGSVERGLLPQLRASLSDGDACVRQTGARLAGRVQVPDLSAELTAELTSSNPRTREAALTALGFFDRQSGVDEARRGLRDPDLGVRKAGAWALGMIEHADAVSALTEAAADPDAGMRRTVAWALGNIEAASAVGTLTRMLQDNDTGVRIQAAYALGQIESAEAIPALIKLLSEDRDPAVRKAAASALGQISG